MQPTIVATYLGGLRIEAEHTASKTKSLRTRPWTITARASLSPPLIYAAPRLAPAP